MHMLHCIHSYYVYSLYCTDCSYHVPLLSTELYRNINIVLIPQYYKNLKTNIVGLLSTLSW